MTARSGITRRQLKRRLPADRLDSVIIPLPDHRLVYVKNAKAGCSTILAWLDALHTGELHHEFRNVHKEHRLPRVNEVGWPRVLDMLSGSGYRFTFVRHPVRRLESVYWDKIVRSTRWRSETLEALGMAPDQSQSPTFEQFLDVVEQQDPMTGMDRHWRPQHLNLMHPVVTYDRIGRLESFAADLELIREEAGLPEVPIKPRNVAPSGSRTDSVYDGRPDLTRRVKQLYARDFELYGY